MLDGVVNFVREKPVTTAAIVLGAIVLGSFVLGATPAGASGYDADGYMIGPSDSQIAASTSLLIAQQESADRRYEAELAANVTLANRAYEHQETQWAIDASDASDVRRHTENINLQSTQLELVRAEYAGREALARVEGTTAVALRDADSRDAATGAREARRANRDNMIGSVVGSLAMFAALAFF